MDLTIKSAIDQGVATFSASSVEKLSTILTYAAPVFMTVGLLFIVIKWFKAIAYAKSKGIS